MLGRVMQPPDPDIGQKGMEPSSVQVCRKLGLFLWLFPRQTHLSQWPDTDISSCRAFCPKLGAHNAVGEETP